MVENQSGRRLKILIYENGGENINFDFIQYCEDAGIRMKHSIPYTPQQIGVAKRKNRSLKEMATCMMEAKNLPPKFWAKAIKSTSYIYNRVPHNHLDGMTPFKPWSGHKLDVTHFRIFGSKDWARIPTEKRKDLKPQSQEFLFVGYSKDLKWYNLIKLSTNKCFIERSV